MAVVYSTAAKNARMAAVVGLIGAGGTLTIGTSALAGATGVLAQVPLANPAFTVAGGVMTVGAVPRTVEAVGTGVADKVEVRASNGTVIISGLTVGLPGSGAEVIINALEVSTGQTIQVTVGTITHG